MEELNRFATEDQFRECCELLERKDDELGQGFHPTKLYPHLQVKGSGGAGGRTVNNDCGFIDQRESGPLLKDVQAARERFTGLSKKHRSVLDKAEGIWTALLAKAEVGV
jgi:hypothetical protein